MFLYKFHGYVIHKNMESMLILSTYCKTYRQQVAWNVIFKINNISGSAILDERMEFWWKNRALGVKQKHFFVKKSHLLIHSPSILKNWNKFFYNFFVESLLYRLRIFFFF